MSNVTLGKLIVHKINKIGLGRRLDIYNKTYEIYRDDFQVFDDPYRNLKFSLRIHISRLKNTMLDMVLTNNWRINKS